VVAYVLSGSIRSQVNDQKARIYQAGLRVSRGTPGLAAMALFGMITAQSTASLAMKVNDVFFIWSWSFR